MLVNDRAASQMKRNGAPANGGKGEKPAARRLAPKRTTRRQEGLIFERRNTKPGEHPFDGITWDLRSATIANDKGEVIFEQRDVEVPEFWSQLAVNVVVSKYFRGGVDTPDREKSVKHLIERVSGTLANWGRADGMFRSEADAETFYAELTHLLVHQKLCFNSPVWFNMGIEEKPQCSACFINSVEDSMGSILDLAKTEGMLFKWGSGTGTNLSPIRSSKERLSSGGWASGPVSFMRGYDAFAGVIKSGGKTRRAAKMQILNIDHPDVVDFINAKQREEKKAWALIDAGYDPSINGEAYGSVFFQNANLSVRVSNDFMQAVIEDREWSTKAITTGQVMETYKARDLLKQIAEGTWICGDPGMQFDTTVNDWHTCPNTDRIHASNPCVTGDTLVATSTGLLPIAALVNRPVEIIAGDGQPARIAGAFKTGTKPVYLLRTSSGYTLRLTADHRVRTLNRGDVPALELTRDDLVEIVGSPFGTERISTELAEIVGLSIGDGCLSQGILTISMSRDERPILEKVAAFANSLKPNRPVSVTETETTLRVATTADELVSEVSKWAVLDAGSEKKALRDVAFTLDRRSAAALLRGLFTTDGTVANYGEKSQYVALDSTSLSLLRQTQSLLLNFGIKAKIYENRRAFSALTSVLPDGKGGTKEYPVLQMHSLRISRSSRLVFEREIGFSPGSAKQQRLAEMNRTVETYTDRMTDAVESLTPAGVEDVFDLTEPRTNHFVANGIVVHNCSEYMFLDNSACNLASLNLMKFRRPDGEFDVAAFRHAVDVAITAMEIIVDNASYPTPRIEASSHRFRPLGLGYANLGALLMARGMPYDSEAGRSYSAAITALMHGQAYLTSARISRDATGPFEGYPENAQPFLRVIDKHRFHAYRIPERHVPSDLLAASREVFDAAYETGQRHGLRNAQVTVIAPTGTIAFMMDCDTTGIEPDIALVKYKKLVGGGLLKIVNQTVPEALRRLDYTEAETQDIVAYIDENETIEGAPHLKDEHLPVFDCAFKPANGVRSIHYMGHVRMMSACQPFLSGAISKTVNMPSEATAEEILQTYIEAWRLGLKAIAIYRDGCKRTQPLNTSRDKPKAEAARPMRRRLPDERKSITHKFSIGGHEGYLTVGMYEDGTPGELFITMAKEGTVVSGLMDAVATSTSISLQYGVPLKVLVNKFSHMRFEPAGFTGNPQIPIAKSILDYIFRWLSLKFMPADEVAAVTGTPGSDTERIAAPVAPTSVGAARSESRPPTPGSKEEGSPTFTFQLQADAPPCHNCGTIMVRNGSCYKCVNCGSTSGCS